MSQKKDIKFTEKKVDSSWKDSIQNEKKGTERGESTQSAEVHTKEQTQNQTEREKLSFSTFINSLGMQALFHLGEIPNPVTKKKEVNLDAVNEIIEILAILKEKTVGNLSENETQLISSLLYDLQMTYVNKVKAE